jgi:hypothetical protein
MTGLFDTENALRKSFLFTHRESISNHDVQVAVFAHGTNELVKVASLIFALIRVDDHLQWAGLDALEERDEPIRLPGPI